MASREQLFMTERAPGFRVRLLKLSGATAHRVGFREAIQRVLLHRPTTHGARVGLRSCCCPEAVSPGCGLACLRIFLLEL